MKIRNKTDYPTRAIRRVLCEVYRRTSKTEGALPQWARVRFVVVYSCQGGESGYAYRRGTLSRLRIGRGGIDPARLARLADHELLHLYGHRHAGMPCALGEMYWTREYLDRFAWASDLVGEMMLEAAAPERPGLDERRARRMEQTAAAIARWEPKLKRAENALRKLRARARRLVAVAPGLAVAASPSGRR
jgi:hypothetical protein